jgi:molybdate transport system permease protein
MSLRPLPLVLVAAIAAACAPSMPDREVEVFAAASLQGALDEVARAFERQTGIEVRVSYGGSGDLASQLLAAPRADLFLSAGSAEVERLRAAGLVRESSTRTLLGNRLVVVEPAGMPAQETPFEPERLTASDVARLAIGDPTTAPAGRYARDWLERHGLLAAVSDRLLPTPSVRATLGAVESGAARFGIVYRTDAESSDGVRVVFSVPSGEHAPIAYPLVRLLAAEHPAEAAALEEYLDSPTARELFARHGFEPPPADAALAPSDGPLPGAGSTIQVLLVTLRVALGATLLVALPALALGFLLARRTFVGRSLVETVVALPLVLPPTAIGYLLLALLAQDGPLGPARLGFDPGLLFTQAGAIVAAALMALPLATRTARIAFEGVDPRLVLMGRSLGLSPVRAFLAITLPLAGRGLLAALLLAFGRALGEFGATVIVAGNLPGHTQTLALAIFSDIQVGDRAHALGLVGICVALAFTTILVVERLLARAPRPGGRGR